MTFGTPDSLMENMAKPAHNRSLTTVTGEDGRMKLGGEERSNTTQTLRTRNASVMERYITIRV